LDFLEFLKAKRQRGEDETAYLLRESGSEWAGRIQIDAFMGFRLQVGIEPIHLKPGAGTYLQLSDRVAGKVFADPPAAHQQGIGAPGFGPFEESPILVPCIHMFFQER
jgi:hypothetical protein